MEDLKEIINKQQAYEYIKDSHYYPPQLYKNTYADNIRQNIYQLLKKRKNKKNTNLVAICIWTSGLFSFLLFFIIFLLFVYI